MWEMDGWMFWLESESVASLFLSLTHTRWMRLEGEPLLPFLFFEPEAHGPRMRMDHSLMREKEQK